MSKVIVTIAKITGHALPVLYTAYQVLMERKTTAKKKTKKR
jgi:hypothetical protein